ncbi:MFS transporter [Amnibacterium sp. CER49]|uniref:MFS transporter n=1 Tax=Amnibacterium sp. CER49 TaxID=3039161 RepID=UPI00244A07D4|nr:MFS transporter [Amnibacterium sp. CER49]MDH2442507.1 MFS transporter [Amnibacterium sp. CER49]
MRGGGWRRVVPAIAMLGWGGNHFTPLLLLYRQHEGYTSVEVDLLFALYVLGIVPGFLVSGPLSDRYGRRPLLLAGVALGCVGSLVLAFGAASVPVLGVGRFVSGVSVAVAMVVGSSWIKELSAADHVPGPVAARRASLTLTAGFGLGPAVSGVLAQWGPAPTLLPYLVHVALTLAVTPLLLRAAETRHGADRSRPLLADLGVPRDVRRRFLTVVAPAAPWVFGSAGLAFAVTPALVASRTGADAVVYATLLAVVALAFGAGIQQVAIRIGRWTGGRQLLLGLALAVLGTLLAALEAVLLSPPFGLLVAAVLGCAYGLCLVSGLTEVQRMARPDDLAGVTAVYYSLTYVGFVFPVVLAALAPLAPEALQLVVLAALTLAAAIPVARNLRRA